TMLLVSHEEPKRPSQLGVKLPRDLETICLKCLHKEPAKRYPTAEALAEDLRRFLADEPICARPVSRWERGLKWVKRKPAIAAAGFLLAALLAGAAGWAVREQTRSREREIVRQATVTDVTVALREAADLAEQGKAQADDPERWGTTLQAARSAWQRAEGILNSGVP